LSSPYTTLGLPPDGVAWSALFAACALLFLLRGPSRRVLGLAGRPGLLLLISGSAALLSAGYVHYYLRGGPRIIDATSYYLQARAMAHGYFAFPVPEPLGSFNGRFLLESAPRSLSVIFPPGYAAFLSIGFLLHAPLAMGPLLAALLAWATYGLAYELTRRREVALSAAALSMLCAALRYHTADTMSHGLSALLLCTGTLAALRAQGRSAVQSGLVLGLLCATRPVSGAVGVALAIWLLDRRAHRLLWFAAGLVPGLALLAFYQRAATGSYWASTQLAYYALADGPPDCFRYGFGRGIGCLFEHGDYVRARLANGYGLGEAVSVTVRRLAVHSIDIANAAPLALLCPVGAWHARADRRVRAIFVGCLGLMLAYAPFYFDASYPGGGARLFADLLPLEHVLLALALARFDWGALAFPLSLAGFALHASFAHRALAERDGGRPMFEPGELARAGIDRGLVFIDTDHGFNLGHDPGQLDAQHQVVVARYEHDAHDFWVWERLGRPASYRYSYLMTGARGHAELAPYTPSNRSRFEAEAEWPPLAVRGGYITPDFYPCASGGRGLRLHPSGPESGMSVSWPSPAFRPTSQRLRLGWVREPGRAARLTVSLIGAQDGGQTQSVSALVPAGPADCVALDFGMVRFPSGPGQVRLESSAPGLLDYIELESGPPTE